MNRPTAVVMPRGPEQHAADENERRALLTRKMLRERRHCGSRQNHRRRDDGGNAPENRASAKERVDHEREDPHGIRIECNLPLSADYLKDEPHLGLGLMVLDEPFAPLVGSLSYKCLHGDFLSRVDLRAKHRVTAVILMTRRPWIALLATVFLSSLAGAAQNIDKGGGKAWWPQFRGPNSSGIGTGKPPVQFGPGEKVLWKVAVGPGLSSPIVWNGRIFLTEFDSANKQLATLCIDQRTGKILWRRTVRPETIEKVHEISSPAGSTPVTDGERLYVYFGSYGLIAYDRDGNTLWERRFPNPENPYGAVASPIVAGDLLILNHQGKDAYCSVSTGATAGRSGKRTAPCCSTDGPLPCIGVTTGLTRFWCWAATSNRTSGSWPTTLRMEQSAGGSEDCRRAGKVHQSSATG